MTRFLLSILIFLVASPAMSQDEFYEEAALEMLNDDQSMTYLNPDFEILVAEGAICFLMDNPDLIKIHITDYNAFLTVAQILRWSGSPMPVQTIFNGGIENDGALGYCILAYCYKDGVFTADNEVTAQMLEEDPVMNLNGFLPVDVVETEILPKDPVEACIKTNLTINLDAKCKAILAKSQKVREEMCLYIYYTRRMLLCKKDGCGLAEANTAEETACKAKWIPVAHKICKKELADKGKSPGHMPDVCVGGEPNPGGCFLPQDTACNKAIGTSCGGSVSRGRKVKFKDIVITGVNCKYKRENPLDTKYVRDAVCAMVLRKKKFYDWVNNDRYKDDGALNALLTSCGLTLDQYRMRLEKDWEAGKAEKMSLEEVRRGDKTWEEHVVDLKKLKPVKDVVN